MNHEPMTPYEALPDDLADALREGLSRRVLDVFSGMPSDLARDSINHALFALDNRSVVTAAAQHVTVVQAPTSAAGQAGAQPPGPPHQS